MTFYYKNSDTSIKAKTTGEPVVSECSVYIQIVR